VATSDAKVEIVSSTNASVVAAAIVVEADLTAKTVTIGSLMSRGRGAITTTITITGLRATEPQSLPTSQDKTLLTRSRLNAQTTHFASVVEARTARHRTDRAVVIIDEMITGTTMVEVTAAALEETGTTTRKATTLSSSSPRAANRCRVLTTRVAPPMVVVTKEDSRCTSSKQEAIPRDAGTAAEAANERLIYEVSSRDTKAVQSLIVDRVRTLGSHQIRLEGRYERDYCLMEE
jgi:hypothetical protein